MVVGKISKEHQSLAMSNFSFAIQEAGGKPAFLTWEALSLVFFFLT